MSQMFGLAKETIEKINSVFAKYPKISIVVIYGSRAKGTNKPGSDIDLVIFSDDFSLSELMSVENELDDLLLPYSIDLSNYANIEDESLLSHIARAGKTFYLRGG